MLLDLLFEYKRTLRETRKQKEQLEAIPVKRRTNSDNEDIKQYSCMISHLQFVVEWLENGRLPGAKRGYDRREVYKRMVVTDPRDLESIHMINSGESSETVINEWDKQRLDDALSVLSNREKDIYMLHHAHLMSYEEIGELLCIKKTTVQTHHVRAQKKLEKRTENSLFCLT